MEFLLFGGTEYQRLYNCSFYNVSDIPLEERKSVPIGVSQITFLGVEMVLYVICMVSIWSRRQHTCYKIMFAMGVLDMVHLVIVGPMMGVLKVFGLVFCSAPTFFYIMGCVGMGSKIAEEFMDLLLAANRCFYFTLSELALELFPEGKCWTWVLTAVPVVPGLLYTVFGLPCVYSAVTSWGVWNPHVGYANDLHTLYDSGLSTQVFKVINWIMLTTMPVLYTTFFVAVLKQSLRIGAMKSGGKRHTSAVPVFFQSFTISVLQVVNSFLKIYRIGTDDTKYAGVLGIIHCCVCSQSSGICPIIYLCCNKKIRGDVLWYLHTAKKLFLKKYRKITSAKA